MTLDAEGIGATQEDVERLLSTYELGSAMELRRKLATIDDAPGVHPPSWRVQAAVLIAADGDWRRALELVELAHIDYRDVLVAAFYRDC